MSEAEPATFGRYNVLRVLAHGGQSKVWLCKGPDGPVAVKSSRGLVARKALLREAVILQKAPHPILATYVDHASDGSWLALEYINGEPIDVWSEGRPATEITAVFEKLITGILHLHRHKIVHGDVKPSNVLVTGSGAVTLLDLGVARRINEKLEGFTGTLGYAAPELLQGAALTASADVYSVGALLYRCLAGRTPFVAPDPAALGYLPLVSLPLPITAFDQRSSRKLDRVVLRMLARNPANRPGNLAQVVELLRRSRGVPHARPVIGMLGVRDELLRAVVAAADDEGRVAVVYGPPGCGRRTLIAETVEAARREGLTYIPPEDTEAFVAAARAGRPPVTVVRTSGPWQTLADAIFKQRLSGLVLIHSDRPKSVLPRGAIQVTPPPLSLEEAKTVARLRGADVEQVPNWWRKSKGTPMLFIGFIEASQRGPSPLDRSTLPGEARRLLDALDHVGEARVCDLAVALKLDEHSLLDWCDLLLAHEAIEVGHGGITIRIAT